MILVGLAVLALAVAAGLALWNIRPTRVLVLAPDDLGRELGLSVREQDRIRQLNVLHQQRVQALKSLASANQVASQVLRLALTVQYLGVVLLAAAVASVLLRA